MAGRRRFEPSSLVAGVVFLTVAAGFGGEAAGMWSPDPRLVVPVVVIGLLLSGVTGAVTRSARRRRGASDAQGGGGAVNASVSDDGAAAR